MTALAIKPADRLADHCDVILAPSDAHPWIARVFHDKTMLVEGAVQATAGSLALRRLMRSGDWVSALAVPRGHPDDWVGWIVGGRGMAIYLFVRGEYRRQGIGTKLIRYLQPRGPIGVAYWTRHAVEGAAHGLPVEHSVDAYAALLSFKRKGM